MANKTDDYKKNRIIADILKGNPELNTPLKDGDSIEAEFISKDAKRAYFNIPSRGTGILYGIEFLNARDMIRGLNPGDPCKVTIVSAENDEGFIEVSLVQALQQKSWQNIKSIKESGETTVVKIQGANSGGLVTEIAGTKAFIPVSQLGPQNYPHVEDGDKNKILEELKKFIGTEMEVSILDYNAKNNKLILSERGATEDVLKKEIEQFVVGAIVEVVVSGVADFGVFVHLVDNPNIEGLVHISEIDHRLIESPKEVVKVGDSLKAQIIEIKNNRVSLSFKALKENPWDKAEEYYKEGGVVTGMISKYNTFGTLVSLEHDLQGFVHVSDFTDVETMKQELPVGSTHTFSITSVKPAEKRIILKIQK